MKSFYLAQANRVKLDGNIERISSRLFLLIFSFTTQVIQVYSRDQYFYHQKYNLVFYQWKNCKKNIETKAQEIT